MVRLVNKTIAVILFIILSSNLFVMAANEWEKDILLDISEVADTSKELPGRAPNSLKEIGKVPQSNYKQILRHNGTVYMLENVRYLTEVGGLKMYNWKYRVINGHGNEVYSTPDEDYMDGKILIHKDKLMILLYKHSSLQLIEVESKKVLATYKGGTTRDSMIVFAQSVGKVPVVYVMVGQSRFLEPGKAEDTHLLMYFYGVFNEIKGPEYKFRNLWITGPAYWDGARFKFVYNYHGRIVYELNCNPKQYEEVAPMATYKYGSIDDRQVATIVDMIYDEWGTLYMTRYRGNSIYKMSDNKISRFIDIPGAQSIHLIGYDNAFIVYDYESSKIYEVK